jgi:hypothetical protein
MKKSRQDLFYSEVLRKFYETEIEPNIDYEIPFEFLYDDELQDLHNSLQFKMFNFKYKLNVFIKKIADFLTL